LSASAFRLQLSEALSLETPKHEGFGLLKTLNLSTMKKKMFRPEDNRNNVAYYKKKLAHNLKEKESVNLVAKKKVETKLNEEPELNLKQTPTELPTSQIAKPSLWPLRSLPIEKRKTKIEPAFAGMDSRVVVRVTHFNNKKFTGYITECFCTRLG
jgi:hypothetical protein